VVPAAAISGGKNESIYVLSNLSVLLLLFAAGHTFGFRQNNPAWGADAVLGLMRSIHFDAQGFRDLLGFLQRVRAFFLRVSSVRSGLSVAAGRTSGRDFGTRAQHCVGACHLLCRSHSFELEIRLRHPHHFLNPDYTMFDGGRMAFSEAGFDASIAILR
jgi:hypothetical protein